MGMMTARMRLVDWIAPLAKGAAEVDWDAVYAEEMPRVYNFFRYRVGDDALAEDLTSITFEKAWRARDRYRRDVAKFSTWLFTIARNVATDHYRQRRHDLPIEAAEHRPSGESPEDDAIRRAQLEMLSTLLGGLGERELELVSLKFGAGLTNRAIAGVTGLSESNVGTILHRTVSGLRTQWQEKVERL
jgi:RNA polymerase sigma-70 factor (ECF subfamily)